MKITTIWWWTWIYNILKSLKKIPWINIFSIISMSDDWWSTWKIRDEYGVLPPWDLRKWIIALSDDDKVQILRDLFNYRFQWWGLDWHNLGNLILIALENITWDYWKAIDSIEEILDLKWKIYPVTFEQTRLLAKLENWKYVFWEKNIDKPQHDWNLKISNLYVIKQDYFKSLQMLFENNILMDNNIIWKLLNKVLKDIPVENDKIWKVLSDSDFIILWPWDLYTSILPNILIWNVKDNIIKSKAKKILFVNLFTKYWETSNFNLSDFINEFSKYFWKDVFDYILVHDYDKYPIPNDVFEKYKNENKNIIKIDIDDDRIIRSDFIKITDFARHDPDKMMNVIVKLIN